MADCPIKFPRASFFTNIIIRVDYRRLRVYTGTEVDGEPCNYKMLPVPNRNESSDWILDLVLDFRASLAHRLEIGNGRNTRQQQRRRNARGAARTSFSPSRVFILDNKKEESKREKSLS
jgi:hypothetical protein